MQLTKYGHACVVLEEQGKKLIIDPGEFTDGFGGVENVAAVVITHTHHDHFVAAQLDKIVAANPNVKVYTTPETVKDWQNNPHARAAKAGDQEIIGPFSLRFYGELHNQVHPVSPANQNIGVQVNNFYYPGDSFVMPDGPVDVLAVPAAAPWMKVGEAMDFVKAVKPKKFFRTHDGLLNERGLTTTDRWFSMASDKFGSKYLPLNPGDSIEV
jgi:L-ascorbate metabolism protein UlaG (beta-lactamase superfamily)